VKIVGKEHFSSSSLFGASLYLSIFFSTVYLTILLSESRFDMSVPAWSIVMMGLMLVVIFLEIILPNVDYQGLGAQSEKTDVFYLVLIGGIYHKLVILLFGFIFIDLTVYLSTYYGIDNTWVHGWPVITQALIMLLVSDFARYWVHRAAHQNRFLWRFHAVHHSSEKLGWLATMRFHPVEKFYFMVPEMIPFIILGVGEEVLAVYFVMNGTNAMLQHANIRMNLGVLNWVFNLQEYHLWHHSKKIDESNSNYGINFIIWDIVFGTRFLPADREVSEIGLVDTDYPKKFLHQMIKPFK